ncbi:hypothetical protein DET65_3734 [Sunxiuqinia elliptica]|uniref:Uncharacterized protein n=1 Tax=Sunxiuqinia elliptica TaxID=655355 RepID=A0A4R6GXA2_9BACT|nr:hypothetical protein DET52_106170 [Sunxiuqinia elliptica]TDO57149.1 hypothetical protein DET65_3734 [Sunxiuqinia elliptica]
MKESSSNQKSRKNKIDFLRYSSEEINKNFKIKVSGFMHGCNHHKLVGVSGLVEIVGLYHANNMLDRAFKFDQKYKCECKLRSGLKVTFYYQ